MVWSVADLRALEAIPVAAAEIVYAYVSLRGGSSRLVEELLDDEESERAARFVHPPDRDRFVLAHAALRVILARSLGVEPAAVTYELGPHGKPRLAPGLPQLQFNLSHSGDVGLVAVARDRPLGVDIERLRELDDLLELADRHFSVEERGALHSLPPHEQRDAFFRCWTRKEALIKAIGAGLGHPLDSFDVDLASGSTSALRRYAGRPGAEAELSLRELGSPAGYVAAGSVAAARGARVRWRALRPPRSADR